MRGLLLNGAARGRFAAAGRVGLLCALAAWAATAPVLRASGNEDVLVGVEDRRRVGRGEPL
ncbi:MAG: hypothetical protein RMK20_14200, partial [Verrucomicrobiales bacterium]|nr:hypothetical protein [Verrucomicrobiales bacterium]